eukprot:4528198-Pyramimonas_sp.AAC.1
MTGSSSVYSALYGSHSPQSHSHTVTPSHRHAATRSHGHTVTQSWSHLSRVWQRNGRGARRRTLDSSWLIGCEGVLNSSTLTNPVRARPVWCCHMYIPANLWMPRARIFSEWVGYWPTGRDPHLYGGGEIAILNSRRQNIVQGVGKV